MPFPSPGDLPDLGIEPESVASPPLWADSSPSEPPGKPLLERLPDKKKIRNEEAWAISHHCLSTTNPETQESGQLTLQSSGEF